MEGITIEVCGVPDRLPADRTVDKLTIHFLRPRNGGGEIVKVIYPTSTKGQAFVVFELKEVAAKVAGLKQTLEVDGQQFPLKVGIIDGSEEDLPVQATLDLRKFPDGNEVRQLLRKHNFKVTELSPGAILLEGTFLSLRAVRCQLSKLLQQGSAGHLRARSASASNGTPAHDVLTRKSSTLPHANGTRGIGNESYPSSGSRRHLSPEGFSGYRSPAGMDSFSGSSDQSLSLSSSHRSRERARSHHPNHSNLLQDADAPQSLPILPSHSLASKPPIQRRELSPREMPPSAMSPREMPAESFSVDTYGYRYTYCFKRDQVDGILMSHGVVDTAEDDAGVTTITLKGKDCGGAKQKLQDLINNTTRSLRHQKILLSEFSHEEAVQISKRIQTYKDVYKVLVNQVGSCLEIVGSSQDSYDMMQRLLGKPVDDQVASARVGRGAERGLRTSRSSSLPKRLKVRPDQDYGARDSHSYGSSSKAYSPSHYQDEKHVDAVAVAAMSPRRRTSSESRDRATSQRSVPTATRQDSVPGPSNGGKAPQIKKSALSFNTDAITSKFKSITARKPFKT